MDDEKNRPVVPPHIRYLTPYQAGKTIAEVKKAYNPSRISKLASNENRLGCSNRVKLAVEEAMDQIQDYPDPIARKLRAKIAERNQVAPENVILACGSESLISILCRTFFLQGEEALTADVTFASFFVFANGQNVPIRTIPLTDDYRFDLQAMADAITDQTKLIYIANPNNPTGTYISKAEFEAFMRQVPQDVLVVMDEAYHEYARIVKDYPNSLDYAFDNVLTLRTFSKAYGLAGFRIGYGIGHSELIEMMMKTKLTFEPTTLAQAAALAAYNDTDFLKRSRIMVEEGKGRLYSFFDEHEIKWLPSVANFVLIVLPDEQVAETFNQAMLREGVILRRVKPPNWIRVTIGTAEEMEHFETSFLKIRDQILANKKV